MRSDLEVIQQVQVDESPVEDVLFKIDDEGYFVIVVRMASRENPDDAYKVRFVLDEIEPVIDAAKRLIITERRAMAVTH